MCLSGSGFHWSFWLFWSFLVFHGFLCSYCFQLVNIICCCVSLRQWRGWCTPTLSPVSPDTIQSPLSTPLSLVPTPLVGVCACVFGAKRFGSIILCCPRPRPQSSEGLLDCSEAAAATPPHTGSPLHPATLTPHTSHLHTLPGQWDTSRRCV